MPKFEKSSVSKAPPTLKKEYGAPFTMKGNPMQRNFGIGNDSPMEDKRDGSWVGHDHKTKAGELTGKVAKWWQDLRGITHKKEKKEERYQKDTEYVAHVEEYEKEHGAGSWHSQDVLTAKKAKIKKAEEEE